MNEDRSFDAVVIGAGSGGVACATALAQGGLKRVAVIERERVGGECAFWACVPSKVLLRAEQPREESARVPGSMPASDEKPAFAAAAAWRTAMVDNYDDGEHAAELAAAGAVLLRGAAHVVAAGEIEAGGERYHTTSLVVATGSRDRVPPIEGIERCPYWTSRDATAAGEVPASLLVLGAGAVGVELGQMFARFGSSVTLIDPGPHVLPQESAGVAELVAKALQDDGVTIETGAQAKRLRASDAGVELTLDDGRTFAAARVLVAAGRQANAAGLGLEALGIALDDDGNVPIDDACRAAEGVYAVGDVTGTAMFTHVAKYQARVAAANILGKTARATYDAVPRCIYTAPEVAATGKTFEAARKAGIDAATARVNFDEITRPSIYFKGGAAGAVELIGNRATRTLAGGWIVGPMASEMIGFVSSAIATGATYQALLDVVQPYPTFSEAFYVALDRLARA